ncbi:putative ribonuclease H-like domain-containing protein, partial [Tanacetum coccineum]
MAQLKYCDKHNQVGFLCKPGESAGFAEIVDFLRGSNLRYALTANPTIYDSLVKQFWQSAIANTKADGSLEINATIDTIRYTISEASIRDSLQLDDATGITMLPNEELFEGMGQIGYPTDGTFTFWKSFFTPQWRYLVHHLLHCISSKSGGWDQFGSNIATALICLSTGRVYNFSKLIFDGMVANLKSKTKFLMYPRFLQMILNIQTENKHLYLAVSLTKKIFGNMKRGFRGAPRPLLPSMLLVATNPNAGQEHAAVAQSQPSSSTPQVQPPTPTPPPITTPTPPPITTPTPPPITTPTPPPIPTPSSPPPITETEPTQDEHIYEEQSPVHHHFSPPQAQAPSQMPMDDLLHEVPKLISRIDSLEMDLKQTKLTMGNAIVKLVKKVKKLEGFLKRRNLVLTDSEEEKNSGSGEAKVKMILLILQSKGLFTPPTTKVNTSGEEQVEEITTISSKLFRIHHISNIDNFVHQDLRVSVYSNHFQCVNSCEYEMWRLRIEQYFEVQDYALWDVLENGNSFKPTARTTTNADGTSNSMIPVMTQSIFLANLPNGSQLVHEDLEQIHEDDLEEMDLKWQLALLSMRARRYFQRSGKKITINGCDTAGYDKNQVNSRRTVNVEETSSKAMVAINGAGFDWSFMADEEVPTNMALMAFSDSEDQIAVLKRDTSFKDSEINALKSLFVTPTIDLSNSGLEEFQQPEFEGYRHKASKIVCKDTSNEVEKTPDAPLGKKLVLVKEKQTVFLTKIESVKYKKNQLANQLTKFLLSRNNYTRVNYNYSAKKTYPSAQRNMVSRAVLMKTGLISLNTTRPVNTAHPKTTVYSARPMSHFSKSAQSTDHPQKENQGYIDSGCSRHMTRNMSYLSDFKEFNGGYVTFGGGAKGGKITGKGTLKTSKLDFEDVYFVKELQFNLLFKNRVMSEFYEQKGIKREFSVARTPQQNGVAERRNKTLIEAARTIGRTPALSLMRPFGCHVTILNTLDYLGKFNGKSDDGFFIGYSLTSKAFRVYNIRTRKVKENLHIRFLENKPIEIGDGPKWLFDIDSLTKSMNYVPVIASTNSNVMPLWKDSSLFDSPSTKFSHDKPEPSCDAKNKDDEGVSNASGFDDQEIPESSTPNINTAGPSINTARANLRTNSLQINTIS